MTKTQAKKIFKERFSEIPFDNAFENIAGYVGTGDYGYSFIAFDGWRAVLDLVESFDEDDLDCKTYVSEKGIQNGHRYYVFMSASFESFIVEIEELRRQMLRDVETLIKNCCNV